MSKKKKFFGFALALGVLFSSYSIPNAEAADYQNLLQQYKTVKNLNLPAGTAPEVYDKIYARYDGSGNYYLKSTKTTNINTWQDTLANRERLQHVNIWIDANY